MNISFSYINPFSKEFRESMDDFKLLSVDKKVIVVASSIFGAMMTFFLLGLGGVALFQLTVKWLKSEGGSERQIDSCLSAPTFGKASSMQEERAQRLYEILVEDDLAFESYVVAQGYSRLSNRVIQEGYTGRGYCIHATKSCRAGNFVGGMLEGNGIEKFRSEQTVIVNHIYEGNFLGGVPHGKGFFAYLNDRAWYQGDVSNGARSGRGTYRNPEKKITTSGEFFNGVPHGRAKVLHDDGSFVEGEFVNGIVSGVATKKFSDGRKYTGEFLRGLINGHGTMTYPDGRVEEGVFLDGVLLN